MSYLKFNIMKNKFIFVIFLILGLNAGCHEVTVGYLWLEDPGYNPDTLLVKQESSLNISAPSWGIGLIPRGKYV